MDGMLLIVSGPSGSGKSTVAKKLNELENYALSVSITARAPRDGERDGREYFFRTEEEFNGMLERGELLEHAEYINNLYGTPRAYVEEKIAEGKTVVLEIEVEGALQVKEKFPEAVLVFLIPPSLSELSIRLKRRKTDDSSVIEKRLKRALEEISFIPKYQYLVVNDEVEKAIGAIETIVEAERRRPERCAGLMESFMNG